MTPDAGMLLPLLPEFQRLCAFSRRRLLRQLAPMTAASWLATGCRKGRSSPQAAAPVVPQSPGGRVFDATAWRAIEALTARILPSEPDPGAREAHVIAFIDAQLATPTLAPIAPALVATARLLDQVAQARVGVAFAELSTSAQDAIVTALAENQLPAPKFPQREAFRALHVLTLEGFLADPIHGGNRDMVGWRSIDFPEPGLRPTTAGTRPGHGSSHR